MSKRDLVLKIALPILLLLVGVGLTVLLIKFRQPPQPEEQTFSGPLVDTIVVEKEARRVLVKSTGSVQARHQSDITPQVSGRVVEMAPNMVAGGFFKKGELLFVIETVDYQLALDRAMANLALAELELVRIESRSEIAREEWDRLQIDGDAEPNPLVLYEPQMKSAQASVASARAAVKQAELDLSRTRITAPFNCYVRNEQVDLGQYLRSGNKVATVAGTDLVEIMIPLPLEELAWLQVPRGGEKRRGSDVTVQMEFGEYQLAWQGKLIRSLGEIDPRNRMASVVASVEDPFNQEQALELTPGMFVNVVLHGRDLGEVIALPRGALRDDDTVWVVGDNNLLEIKKVTVVRREREEVMITTGLEEGDQVVLSGLSGAADGMLLRPQEREAN